MIILGTNSIKDTGFDVANSLRFNSGSSDYLTKGSLGTGSTTKATFSVWIKKSKLSPSQDIYSLYLDNDNQLRLRLRDNGAITIYISLSNSTVVEKRSTLLLGDFSAWYHVVLVTDLTESAAENKYKIYINNVKITSYAVNTNTSATSYDNIVAGGGSYVMHLGSNGQHGDNFYSGYMAEVVHIDGQALNPTSFGEFDEDSGIWKPIDVSGLTFGTNGFYLDFEDSSALGNDKAGSNNFTVGNLTAIDQSTDTCTNNFATLNPLDNLSSAATFSEGNTTVASTNSGRGIMTATFGLTSGKWYWEVKNSASGGTHASDEWNHIGIANRPGSNTDNILAESGTNSNKVYEYTYYAYDGNHYNNGDQGGYGASFTTNDIIGVLLDLDNNKIYWSKNGAWADGSGNSDENDPNGFKAVTDPASTPGGFYFPACSDGGINVSKTWQWNFGGTPGFAVSSGNADPNGYGNFEYPTEGAYAICSKNLAEFGG